MRKNKIISNILKRIILKPLGSEEEEKISRSTIKKNKTRQGIKTTKKKGKKERDLASFKTQQRNAKKKKKKKQKEQRNAKKERKNKMKEQGY